MKKHQIVSLLAGAAFLSACSAPETWDNNDDTGQPAGSMLSSQGFGSSTGNNVNVQNVKMQAAMVQNLTRVFASEAPATINFEFNKSDLDFESRSRLDQQAAWIIAHPDITFRVYGHTDKVGTNAYNKALGLRRAQAAVNYLISRGVDKRKVEAVVSFGETQPLVLTEARNRENRRTVTEVKGFFNPNDMLLDGKVAIGIYNRYITERQLVQTPIRPSYNAPTATEVVGVDSQNTDGG